MRNNRKMKELEQLFLNLESPISFSSKSNLYQEAKKIGISRKKVDEFLQKTESWYLFRPAKRKFKSQKMTSPSLFSRIQADIKDFGLDFLKHNDGFRYFLLVIDIYSRKIFTVPLKTKGAKEVLKAFEKIFNENNFLPNYLFSDLGKEFFNQEMTNYCKENEIKQVNLNSSVAKAAIAERAIQTICQRLIRVLSHNNSYRWIDYLEATVKNYNNTVHSSIKMKPADVDHKTRFPLETQARKKTKLKLGDTVLISITRATFQKGFLGNWSREPFKIVKTIPGDPPSYKLQDFNGETLQGRFYEAEIQKISNEDRVYKIEKILQRKTVKGQKLVLIRWLGLPQSHDSWEPAENLINIAEKSKSVQK